jgi:hypothetical protein
MTNRTVKILGWGTGQAIITAVLDGETIFSGSVDLVEFTEENHHFERAPTVFTFEVPMDFAGTKHMVVSVQGAAVEFGQIIANYAQVEMGEINYTTGADIFEDISDFNSEYVRDPRGDVVYINGEKHETNRALGKGAWHWTVPSGATFEHDITFDKPGLIE